MKEYKQEPYTVPLWIYKAIQVLRPVERLTVSEWAAKYRTLSGGAIPGPWNNDITPYLVEVMDAFTDDIIEEIVFVKPTQVGGTTAMENMIGCLIDQDPAPTMVVYPSDDLAEATSETRLVPMIKSNQSTAEKFRESESKKLSLKFRDMWLYLTGANSPADLSSKPIKNLFLDEVDKFPGASKKEADPVSLARERTKTFFNRKIFMASTPTLKTGHIWKAKEAADVEKHYFVPCPHCGKFIELKFGCLKWPSKDDVPENADRAERTVYVCQECGSIITDHDKGKMLRAGRWQAVRQKSSTPRSVAFWLNTLYSPFTRFSDISREFMRSKGDPDLLHNFTNSWLAEPWEELTIKTNSSMVMDRQTDIPEWTLPPWTKLITGGIDVQKDCLYWVIRAWGDYMTSQLVARGKVQTMEEVEPIMNREFTLPDGDTAMVNLTLMDSGDRTDEVYEFYYHNSDWMLPCKGTTTMTSHYRLSIINKAGSKATGMTLVLVDGGKYKDLIAARMRKSNGQGSWMVFDGIDDEYAEQVTAEHKLTVRSNGRDVERWVKKTTHADNHYLDCEVYAAAAADMMNVRSLYPDESGPARSKQPTPPSTPSEENWISENEEWI